ncbi:MAG TPA: MerR family transcriptional regulator [Noviherbaspirillum sp.]
MIDNETATQAIHSIGAVERDTGLGKDTLRVWERRYGFPQPGRDANGERTYPLDQVQKLRMLKRLIDAGYRPGKIVQLRQEELQGLIDTLVFPESSAGLQERPDLQAYVALCKSHDVEELRRALSQALIRMGLQAFVTEVIAPLNCLVGDCWARGTFAVYEEHLYTEVVQNLLRSAIASIPQHAVHAGVRPTIVLTTLAQEQHGLGLLMAEAMFALEGARCISLGLQTPVLDIVRAVEAQQADIVALSCSTSMPPQQVIGGLQDVCASLPATAELWVGGNNPALGRFRHRSLKTLTLADVPTALAAWHGQRGV